MAAVAAETKQLSAGAVLVVDDDHDFADSLAEILETADFEAVCANRSVNPTRAAISRTRSSTSDLG